MAPINNARKIFDIFSLLNLQKVDFYRECFLIHTFPKFADAITVTCSILLLLDILLLRTGHGTQIHTEYHSGPHSENKFASLVLLKEDR
jgi:hypothetical protein